VLTYLGKGVAIGIGGAGVSLLTVIVEGEGGTLPLPWWTPLAAFPIVGGAGILLSVLKPREWLVGFVEDVLQRDIDGDGQIGNVTYRVEGVLRDKRGNESRLGFDLEHGGTNENWHQFCKAIVAGRNFSEREAKRHGLGGDWPAIYRAFTSQYWASPAGERGTPKLSPTGKAWIRHYARTPPPE
jgi:hypothetical protein